MLFLMKNTVFTVFCCIIQNRVVSVWYNHMPFFSDVETQVEGIGGFPLKRVLGRMTEEGYG